MVMQVRLATEKDVPAIAQNYVGILTESPLFIHFYENVTEEDYRIHREALLRRTLKNAAQRMYVAVHDDGECVGSIIYSVVGLESQGFDKDPALPDLPAPRGTDLSRLNSYFGKLAEWRAELLQNYGPHISGDKLFVVKYGRNVGAATALCLQVKDDALKLGVPVFFDTTYFSFPFYDRMADMQGFVIKYLAQYHLKPGPCALTTFLVQLVPKNEKGKVEKAEKVKSARRRSSGREVDQW